MILSWIQSVVVGSYESRVNEQIVNEIEEKVNPTVEVNSDFPWSNNVGISST